MNAPVTPAVPGPRPAAPRASDTGRAHSAAPFASALDGAVSERASDRGVERRGMRENRAAEHATAKDQRVEDRSRAAADRALDKADRTAARTEQAEGRAADRAAGEAAPDAPGTAARRSPDEDETVPGEAVPEAEGRRTDPPGTSADAPRGGLPALWALMMAGAPSGSPTEDAGAADPAPLPGVPTVDPAGADLPPVPTNSGGATPAGAVLPTPIPSLLGAAIPAEGSVAPSTTAAGSAAVPTGPVLPAAFSAVLAEMGAVVLGSATPADAAPAAAGPAATVPVDLLLGAAPAATPPASGTPAAPTPPPIALDGEVEPAAGSPGSPADEVVAPVGGSAGAALSADNDGSGASGGDDAPPAVGLPAVSTTASVTAPATAVPDVDGAPDAAATLPVGSQVARQVAVLSGSPDGDHSMTLVLTPETLGEVQVQVTLTKGAIELALRGAHEQGRAALLDALPELRRELEAAGLNPSRLEVARETGSSWPDRQPAQQQTSGERHGRQDRGEDRSRPWGRPADSAGSGTSAPRNRSASSGVDVLA